LLKFLKNVGTLLTLVLITLLIIGGSLSGTYQDPAIFSELMKESAKLNVSVALGLGAVVLACLIVQNKTNLKVNKDKYFDYLGLMFYFIVLNLGVFYLAYFPKLAVYQGVLIVYFILTMTSFAFLLFATTKILGTIFNKTSL
jgi:energy-coupling factor transporter transmembrane protein EcfT